MFSKHGPDVFANFLSGLVQDNEVLIKALLVIPSILNLSLFGGDGVNELLPGYACS